MVNKIKAIVLALGLFLVSSPIAAQEVFQISDAYSCVRFGDGKSYISQNGAPDEFTFIDSKTAFKTLKADRKLLRGRIEVLNDIKTEIIGGRFDKKEKRVLNGLLDIYFPLEPTIDTRVQRLAATKELIKILKAKIQILNDVEKAIKNCLGKAPGGKASYLPYGQMLSVTSKAVIIPGSATYGYREAYVGHLLLIKADKTINLASKKKVGTRAGYIACIKNLSTGKTIYAVFDDQPCEDVNFSPQFPDKEVCKSYVPKDSWGTLGYWAPVGAAYPTQEQINYSLDYLRANIPGYFQAVIYAADPYRLNGGPSQLDFRTWCTSGNAY